jgi:hypothetical protein
MATCVTTAQIRKSWLCSYNSIISLAREGIHLAIPVIDLFVDHLMAPINPLPCQFVLFWSCEAYRALHILWWLQQMYFFQAMALCAPVGDPKALLSGGTMLQRSPDTLNLHLLAAQPSSLLQ